MSTIARVSGAIRRPASLDKPNSNAIKTTRYTWVTWLPKSVFAQFRRSANLYFVAVAVIAALPQVEALWQPKVLSVVLLFLTQALKDLFEDVKCSVDDRKENTQEVMRYDAVNGSFEDVPWADVGAGDLLAVHQNEAFPADMLVVDTSEAVGNFFVSTKSIDGESNLKERQAVAALLQVGHSAYPPDAPLEEEGCAVPSSTVQAKARMDAVSKVVGRVDVEITMDVPKPAIDTIHCTLSMDGAVSSAGHENFGLRGCVLRNTRWVLGVACYTGNDSKVRLNSVMPPTKKSKLELQLNNQIASAIAAILCGSAAFAFGHEVSKDEFVGTRWFTSFLKYVVMVYPILPITFYVSLEIMHLAIGRLIEKDPLLVDEETLEGARARNTDVLEDMGQVRFVFSDKTGTLTANEMVFAFCTIGKRVLGPFLPCSYTGQPGPGHSQATAALESADSDEQRSARAFFESLAVCHTVRYDVELGFQGESPDEVTLVEAASSVGVKMVSRRVNPDGTISVEVESPWSHTTHTVLHVLPFDSDRKRMSVVCAAEEGGVLVITKGADSVMEVLIDAPLPPEAEQSLKNFSRQGLRTLVVARRHLDAEAYATWKVRWDAACAAGQGAEVAEAAQAVERGLEYLGVVANEDRLQDQVPETIATLREAGIRVWVLTGDKVETAVEIAKSCKLFDSNMELTWIVDAESSADCVQALEETGQGQAPSSKRGLVLDGKSVGHILGDRKAGRELYRAAMSASSCVCCRLSPLQKRNIIELVRRQDKNAITLAIGDGANDAPMIHGAHVGVGIRGKEGSAAVQAADVAISQFHFLGNLVFCHGRASYRKIALFLCISIYKQSVLLVAYVIYTVTSDCSGKGPYSELLDILWSPLTTASVVLMVIFDRDYSDEHALRSPALYAPGPLNKLFNCRVTARWIINALFHGFAGWMVPVWSLTSEARLDRTEEFWRASFAALASAFAIVHLKLFIVTAVQWGAFKDCSPAVLGPVAVAIEFALMVGLGLIISWDGMTLGEDTRTHMKGVVPFVLTCPEHVGTIVLAVVVAFLFELAAMVAPQAQRRAEEEEEEEDEQPRPVGPNRTLELKRIQGHPRDHAAPLLPGTDMDHSLC